MDAVSEMVDVFVEHKALEKEGARCGHAENVCCVPG